MAGQDAADPEIEVEAAEEVIEGIREGGGSLPIEGDDEMRVPGRGTIIANDLPEEAAAEEKRVEQDQVQVAKQKRMMLTKKAIKSKMR
mmetsp:Transcript_11965/g.28012  ORF Transcript_11965/g.28012 Transcript_11965/m.28012 type:complete len:88 (-) Transcript_11965:3811-4074(-)